MEKQKHNSVVLQKETIEKAIPAVVEAPEQP